ncbi:MAG: hypothetical protein V4584_08635 [Verrucomicrobiota bacterium]
MQRWIVVGVVAVMLAIGGGGFAYWTYKQNRPAPIWVPLPINSEVSDEKRAEIAKELKEKLQKPEILIPLSKELDLAKRWNLASPEEAAAEIRKRLFVDLGTADSPMGRVPSINIGVRGPRKETDISGKIALRLMQDVWKMLGIKPPAEKPF